MLGHLKFLEKSIFHFLASQNKELILFKNMQYVEYSIHFPKWIRIATEVLVERFCLHAMV